MRLTENGNDRIEQLLVMPTANQLRRAARRALEWIRSSKAWVVYHMYTYTTDIHVLANLILRLPIMFLNYGRRWNSDDLPQLIFTKCYRMQKIFSCRTISLYSSTIRTVNISGTGYCRIFATLECEVGTSCLYMWLDN